MKKRTKRLRKQKRQRTRRARPFFRIVRGGNMTFPDPYNSIPAKAFSTAPQNPDPDATETVQEVSKL